MKEMARITNSEGKHHSRVTYDFDTEILQGQNLTYQKPMPKAEYEKIKANTIKHAKAQNYILTFELVN